MAIVNQRQRKRHRWLRIFKEFRPDQTCDRWEIRLELWGVLAQREEWTRRGVVVFLEQVVNEVRGNRDEIDEGESCRQRADGLPPPWPLVSPSPGAHSEPTVSD
jgi:hypothetical protein